MEVLWGDAWSPWVPLGVSLATGLPLFPSCAPKLPSQERADVQVGDRVPSPAVRGRGSRRGAALCHHLSPSFLLKSLSRPSASQTARCWLTSLIVPHPCLSCHELNAKFGGCPGQAGGVEIGLWDRRQAGSSMRRPCQVQRGSWPWQGEGVPGPVVFCASAPSSLPCPPLACSVGRKSRAMLGPACREPLLCQEKECSPRVPCLLPWGLGCVPQRVRVAVLRGAGLAPALAEPEPVAAYSLPLVSLPSTLCPQFLQWAGVCTLAPGAARGGLLPGCLFQPPGAGAGGPMDICTSMVSSGVCARGSRP